jgi:hypothetical protein
LLTEGEPGGLVWEIFVGGSVHTVKKNAEALVIATKEIRLG